MESQSKKNYRIKHTYMVLALLAACLMFFIGFKLLSSNGAMDDTLKANIWLATTDAGYTYTLDFVDGVATFYYGEEEEYKYDYKVDENKLTLIANDESLDFHIDNEKRFRLVAENEAATLAFGNMELIGLK